MDLSTRKLQTMSGYFGDWTKWIRTSEEGVSEETEFYRKLNLGQRSSLSYEINTNCEVRKTMGSSSIQAKSVLNNAAVLYNERQNTSCYNKQG